MEVPLAQIKQSMKPIFRLTFLLLLPASLLAQRLTNHAEAIVQAYLNKHPEKNASLEFEISHDHLDAHNGMRSLNVLQKKNGIYVRNGLLTISFNEKGYEVVNDHFQRLPSWSTQPAVSAEEAIMVARQFHDFPATASLVLKERRHQADQHAIFERGDIAASDIIARLMYMQYKNENGLRLTWETQLHTKDRQHYWVTYVDANSGQVLDAQDYVIQCTFGEGLVYDNSPEEEQLRQQQLSGMYLKSAEDWDKVMHARHEHEHSHPPTAASMVAPANSYLVLDLPAEAPNDNTAINTQTTVVTDGDATASPNGWTSVEPAGVGQYNYTRGNNAWAFYDPSPGPLGGLPNPATAAPATGGNPVTGPLQFIYPWDLAQEPEIGNNRHAAIVNLFYWNNLIHDIFYYHGFTESGRNFQTNNFGNGGLGNDEVWAQAQDGGGTNNANFLTLADGVNGQMQMYLWTSGTLDSLVQMKSVVPPAATVSGTDKFVALQGALYNTVVPPPTVNLFTNPVTADMVLINAGCGSPEGCGTGGGVGLPPCSNVSGKIVLIDRGTCSFVEKVHGAQLGGAVGVIVMNNDQASPDAVLAMGGTDPTINTLTIPSVMVSYNTGLKLKAALAGGSALNGCLKQDNPPTPKRDGDFDNAIIAHEYGHGISTRTSPQTALGGSLSGDEQGGEGWSDYYALFLTTTAADLGPATPAHPNGVLPSHGIGTYVQYDNFNGSGIRPRLYSIDPSVNEYTFAGSTNGGFGVINPEITIPHGVGFIWCTMLWDLTQRFIDEYGFYTGGANEIENKQYNPPVTGDIVTDLNTLSTNHAGNSLALKLIQKGIQLQPQSPRMTDMRTAILQADSMFYGGYHSCMIWEVFAKRGLGSNTINPANTLGDEADGYGVPTACNPVQVFFDIEKTGPAIVENQSTFSYTITVTNTSPTGHAASNFNVIDHLPAGLTFLSGAGAPSVLSGNDVVFTVPLLVSGASIVLTVNVAVSLPTASARVANYGFEPNNAQGWVSIPGGANNFTLENNAAEAHTGSSYFYCPNTGLATSGPAYLQSPVLNTAINNKQLRFWHHFDTDSGYDGGYVEYTVDGITWTRMPLQTNPYNGDLDGTFNPTGAGAAFTGTQLTYYESAGIIPDEATQVRFAFSEDLGGGGGDGWWIDDVTILANPVTFTNVADVTDPVFSGGRNHTAQANTVILNTLCDDINVLISSGIIADGTVKYAKQNITVDGDPTDAIVQNGSTVKLYAGQSIDVVKGLYVELGGELLLSISDCDQ